MLECLLNTSTDVYCQYCLKWSRPDEHLPSYLAVTHQHIVQGQLSKGDMFGELKVLLIVSFRSVHGWMWVDVWVNVHHSCAQTLDHGESWLGASTKLPGHRPPSHWTGRGQINEGILFGELSVLLFVCFRSVHGWIGYCGNGRVSECLENAILVRRLWTMEKDV